jgi:serine/threonine protein kinase
LHFVHNQRAKAFIKSLGKKQGVNFENFFGDADALSLDLLRKMLVVDPLKRISADAALQHPCFIDFFNRAALEKSVENARRFQFEYDNVELTLDELRDFMADECDEIV